MIYLDTSVMVALFTPEERVSTALDWLAQCRELLISSDWLITETHSALGSSSAIMASVQQHARRLWSSSKRLLQGGVEVRFLDRDRFRQAAQLLQDSALGLRTGDALHLAVALHSCCSHLASFDGRMVQAAMAFGLESA